MPEINHKIRLAAHEVYEVIAHEGNEELKRPKRSLVWSAFVAGICISFSLFCEGFIKLHTPNTPGYFLLDNLGYTVGFLIVIIGRFQLFTENTITVILPLMERLNLFYFGRTMKLWVIVLTANLCGTFLVAILITYFPFFNAAQYQAFLEISDHAVNKEFMPLFFSAIPAGFLIAALVWMMPSIDGPKFWIILLTTYVIAIGDFAHVIAGSLEVFLLLLSAQTSLVQGIGYIALAAAGNIVGGSLLFTLMAYAQVKDELK